MTTHGFRSGALAQSIMSNSSSQGLRSDTNYLNLVSIIANWKPNSRAMATYFKSATKSILRVDAIIYGDDDVIMDRANEKFHYDLNYDNLRIIDLSHTYWSHFMSSMRLFIKTNSHNTNRNKEYIRRYNGRYFYHLCIFFQWLFGFSDKKALRSSINHRYPWLSNSNNRVSDLFVLLWRFNNNYVDSTDVKSLQSEHDEWNDNNKYSRCNKQHQLNTITKAYVGNLLQFYDDISVDKEKILSRGRSIRITGMDPKYNGIFGEFENFNEMFGFLTDITFNGCEWWEKHVDDGVLGMFSF